MSKKKGKLLLKLNDINNCVLRYEIELLNPAMMNLIIHFPGFRKKVI
jgi:hypothetical protein